MPSVARRAGDAAITGLVIPRRAVRTPALDLVVPPDPGARYFGVLARSRLHHPTSLAAGLASPPASRDHQVAAGRPPPTAACSRLYRPTNRVADWA